MAEPVEVPADTTDLLPDPSEPFPDDELKSPVAQVSTNEKNLQSELDKKFYALKLDESPWSFAAHFESLLVKAQIENNLNYLEILLEQGHWLTQQTSIQKNQTDAFTGQKGDVLLTTKYSCGIPVAFLVHHGVIWAPLVSGVRLYLTKVPKITSTQRKQILSILSTAIQGLDYFSAQTKKHKKNRRYVFPDFDGRCKNLTEVQGDYIALNMAAAAGELSIELLKFFKLSRTQLNSISSSYSNRAEEFENWARQSTDIALQSILPELETSSDKRRVYWRYRPGGRAEDTSHGALVVRFLVKAGQLKMVGSTLITQLKNTFMALISKGPERVPSHLEPIYLKGKDQRTFGDVTATRGLARWISLSQTDCNVLKRVQDIQSFKNNGKKIYYQSSIEDLVTLYSKGCD